MQPIAASSPLTAPTWTTSSTGSVTTTVDRFTPAAPDSFLTGLKALSLAAIASVAALSPRVAEAAPTDETRVRCGDYTLRLKPADLDLKPGLHGGVPGLRLRGEWLDTELSRQVTGEDGWTTTHGLRGRLQGQATTYGDNNAQLNLESFRRWEGRVYSDLPATFEVSGGAYRDLLHNSTSVGMQFRQEVKGGDFAFLGQPLAWALDGRQSFTVRVQGHGDEPRRQFHYSMLVGVQRDIQTSLLGHKATVSVIVGPELRGDQQTALHIGPKVKARVRF